MKGTISAFAAVLLMAGMAWAGAPIADVGTTGDAVLWAPRLDYAAMVLSVSLPDGRAVQRVFPRGDPPWFSVWLEDGTRVPDGRLTWELRAHPLLDSQARSWLEELREAPDREARLAALIAEGRIPGGGPVQSGSVLVTGGLPVLPGAPEPAAAGAEKAVADTVSVTDGLCAGGDCGELETWDDEQMKLKDGVLRLRFQDTSSGPGEPTNDWRIVVNDSSSSGPSFFAIEDDDANTMPLYVEADAPDNALRLSDSGDAGFGTATPAQRLHAVETDTPALRLEQSGGAFPTQSWDVAGNDVQFFVRDVTHSLKMPLRIQAGAPTNSLYIAGNGRVGLGTSNPGARLHVKSADGTDILRCEDAANNVVVRALSQTSDVNEKTAIEPVDGREVLEAVGKLPVAEWSFRDDASKTRHLGPMAQDFHAAFGLGEDERHIAPMDLGGVSLAAIQALDTERRTQAARIAQLEARLEKLEALLAKQAP